MLFLLKYIFCLLSLIFISKHFSPLTKADGIVLVQNVAKMCLKQNSINHFPSFLRREAGLPFEQVSQCGLQKID